MVFWCKFRLFKGIYLVNLYNKKCFPRIFWYFLCFYAILYPLYIQNISTLYPKLSIVSVFLLKLVESWVFFRWFSIKKSVFPVFFDTFCVFPREFCYKSCILLVIFVTNFVFSRQNWYKNGFSLQNGTKKRVI